MWSATCAPSNRRRDHVHSDRRPPRASAPATTSSTTFIRGATPPWPALRRPPRRRPGRTADTTPPPRRTARARPGTPPRRPPRGAGRVRRREQRARRAAPCSPPEPSPTGRRPRRSPPSPPRRRPRWPSCRPRPRAPCRPGTRPFGVRSPAPGRRSPAPRTGGTRPASESSARPGRAPRGRRRRAPAPGCPARRSCAVRPRRGVRQGAARPPPRRSLRPLGWPGRPRRARRSRAAPRPAALRRPPDPRRSRAPREAWPLPLLDLPAGPVLLVLSPAILHHLLSGRHGLSDGPIGLEEPGPLRPLLLLGPGHTPIIPPRQRPRTRALPRPRAGRYAGGSREPGRSVVVQAYILIQTEVGKAAQVAKEVRDIGGVAEAEDVTGPYDVIVRAEAKNVDELGKLVVAKIQSVEGIPRTLTCPVVHLEAGSRT